MLVFSTIVNAGPDSKQMVFASPDEAAKTLFESVKKSDHEKTLTILGVKSKSLLESGDPVEDQKNHALFLSSYGEGNKLEKVSDNEFILILGKNNWSFPIPIVKDPKGWYFNTAAGEQEILNRRIGRNELFTIRAMVAYVDAQREYYRANPAQEKQSVYAQHLLSSPDKRDGLYYSVNKGETPSPLGELYAKANAAGYSQSDKETPTPYYGYYYHILTAQGRDASGGARDYLVDGKMTKGYALIAWPAKYRDSGVMTFMINQDGIVYQKDLGSNTEEDAKKITQFNPDKSWRIIKDIP